MNFYIKNLAFFCLLINVTMQTMPFLFDFANPYALDLPIQQVYLQPPNFVLIRFVGTSWVKLDKSLMQISSFTFNNQDIGTARLIGTSKINGLNESKNKIFILNIASASIQYTISVFSNIVFSQQVYLSLNLKWIVVTLPTEIYSYKLLNNSTVLKYSLISDQFVTEVYFSDTMSFIGTSSGKVYKKVITTNSTDFNITLQLLYQHSSQVQNLFIDNNRNLVSQDINLVLMGYDVILSSNVTFDSSFSSKRLSQITYIHSNSYFIFYTELLLVSYNSTTHAYTSLSLLQSSITVAPLHVVALDVVTNQIPFGYVTNSNLLYKFNPCIGNSNYRSSQDQCISFSCSGSACSSCSLSANLCSNCSNGYFVQNGTCINNGTCLVNNCLTCQNSTDCLVCNLNYTLNLVGECQINVQNNTTNTSNISLNFSTNTTNNSSNATINSSNTTNNSSNVTFDSSNTTNNSKNVTQQYLFNEALIVNKNVINNEIQNLSESAQILINYASQINSISSFRYFLTFLMPLFEFFDDYWYYIYHQINYQNLPTLKTFFCIMYQVNNQRLLPGFINVEFANNIVQNLNNYVGNKYQKYTNINVLNIDQNQRYFLVNCQNLFIFQYFIVIVTFLFIKLVLYLLKLSDKNRIQPETDQKLKSQKQQTPPDISKAQKLKISLQKYLKSKTLSRMLVSAFIQSNLIFLMFTASSQLSIFFSFKSIDKISQSLSLIFLFSCVIFGFCFYLLTQNNICDKNKNKCSSVMFETFTLGTKNILNGFIHGMFLQNNALQIVLLMLVKIFLVCILIKIGKNYKSKFKLAITIFYYLFGSVLDIILLINEFFQTSSSTFSHINIVCFVSILSIVILVLLSIVVQTTLQIINFFLHQKNQGSLGTKNNLNKIQPIVQENNHVIQQGKKQFLKFKIKQSTFNNFIRPKPKHPFFSTQAIKKMNKQIKMSKGSHFELKNQLRVIENEKQSIKDHSYPQIPVQKRGDLKIKTMKKNHQLEQSNHQKRPSIQIIQMNPNTKKTWKSATFSLKYRQKKNIQKQSDQR